MDKKNLRERRYRLMQIYANMGDREFSAPEGAGAGGGGGS